MLVRLSFWFVLMMGWRMQKPTSLPTAGLQDLKSSDVTTGWSPDSNCSSGNCSNIRHLLVGDHDVDESVAHVGDVLVKHWVRGVCSIRG